MDQHRSHTMPLDLILPEREKQSSSSESAIEVYNLAVARQEAFLQKVELEFRLTYFECSNVARISKVKLARAPIQAGVQALPFKLSGLVKPP